VNELGSQQFGAAIAHGAKLQLGEAIELAIDLLAEQAGRLSRHATETHLTKE
jgi:hypothetical protein